MTSKHNRASTVVNDNLEHKVSSAGSSVDRSEWDGDEIQIYLQKDCRKNIVQLQDSGICSQDAMILLQLKYTCPRLVQAWKREIVQLHSPAHNVLWWHRGARYVTLNEEESSPLIDHLLFCWKVIKRQKNPASTSRSVKAWSKSLAEPMNSPTSTTNRCSSPIARRDEDIDKIMVRRAYFTG